MARLEIQFLQPFDVGEYISFELVQERPSGTFTKTIREECVLSRSNNGQFNRASDLNDPSANITTVVEFKNSIRIDASGFYDSIDNINNTFVLETKTGYTVQSVVSNASSKISVNVNNPSQIGSLYLTDLQIEASDSDPCNMFKAILTFNDVIYSYFLNSNGIWTSYNSNIVTFDYPRDRLLSGSFASASQPLDSDDLYVYFPYSIYDQNVPRVTGDFVTIPTLTTQKISLLITPTVTGGTIVVNQSGLDDLTLEYSIDNINWQSSNTFTGQPDGSGTMYVRDSYNCSVSLPYTINAIGLSEPYAYVSEANTIGFKISEEEDNINVFKNYYNNFDINDFNINNYCDKILIQKSDTFKIQIKSNFSNIDFKIRSEDGSTISYIPEKLTSNLGRRTEIDGTIYTHQSGRLGMYFESGNVYDENGNVSGTHDLSGNLPDFAVVGNNVYIEDIGGYSIYDVIFDRQIQKRAILIDYQYSTVNLTKKIECIYNALDYEVYEQQLDWSSFEEGLYDCVLTFSDDNYDDITMVSETIDLAEIHEDVLTIFFYNDQSNNKDIFYYYDMVNLIRVPLLEFFGNIKDSSNLNLSDNSAYLTSSTLNMLDEFTFGDFSRTICRKLCIALSCENVFINGIGYSKDGGLSVSKIENTNVYSVEAKMIDNNARWSSKFNSDIGFEADYTEVFIPEILNFNDKFVKK